MDTLIQQLKRSDHVTHPMAAIIQDNIDSRIASQDLLDHHRIILTSNEDVNTFTLMLLAFWIDVKTNHLCTWAEILLPHTQRAATKNPNLKDHRGGIAES